MLNVCTVKTSLNIFKNIFSFSGHPVGSHRNGVSWWMFFPGTHITFSILHIIKLLLIPLPFAERQRRAKTTDSLGHLSGSLSTPLERFLVPLRLDMLTRYQKEMFMK